MRRFTVDRAGLATHALRFTSLLGVLVAASPARAADPPMPTADKAGSADPDGLKRYEGAVILSYTHKSFDEQVFPLSPLEEVKPERRDASNNKVYEPKKSVKVEGAFTHLLYAIPANRSPLEVLRNYQDDIKSKGGKVLFECKDAECGSDAHGNVIGGGGRVGMAKFLHPSSQSTDAPGTPGYCAMFGSISDMRYATLELPGAHAHIAVLAYSLPRAPCKPFADRTYVMVNVVEEKAREEKMVSVKASDMADAITSGGKIALYGIYFESGKADVQPASDATLAEIAKLLKDRPSLNLLVVGHTDNAGPFANNMDLSQRRAAAVVAALTSAHGVKKSRLTPVGVSYAAPVASNKTEQGRAKNRRVELVEN